MSEPQSPILHYVPEWVLRKFREPSLYELDIYTGKTELRQPKKAGSGRDLWPSEIEDRLSDHDNVAARIYRERIQDQQRILLTDAERQAFAMWLAYFYVRSPKRLVNITDFLKDEKRDREGIIERLYADPASSIAKIREINPKAHADTVTEYGVEIADKLMIDMYAHYVRTAPVEKFPSSDDIRHYYMRNATVAEFAKFLLTKYHWTWLHSHYGFVIADDPLVAWHLASNHWDYGLALDGVEVTMPLTLNLTLCLQQLPCRNPNQIRPISRRETRVLNCRQRCSAIKYVWGNTPAALNFITKQTDF